MLIAVSGGADSTALLVGLHRLARELGLDLHAAHLHHGLRGRDADQDLDFVRGLCARLGVPLTRARWDTRRRMRRRGLSGQAGLRVLRREFLLTAARRLGAEAIATAHTADDQLETLLFRLLRGTGLRGLGGMCPRRGPWIKPLLETDRASIQADLEEAGQEWREDRSNSDLHYARNRVRHLAIPALMSALDPALDPARARAGLIRRAAELAREARENRRAVDRWASRLLFRFCRIQAKVVTIDAQALDRHPAVLQEAVLRMLWRGIEPDNALTRRHLQVLCALIRGGRTGARFELPNGWHGERDRHVVRLHRNVAPVNVVGPLRLRVPGNVSWNGCRVKGGWTSADRALKGFPGKLTDVEYFAAEGIEGELEVRAARADETFIPFGRRHPTPIGEFLSKQKVSREQRFRRAVLADHGGILWVIGVRRSARAPITATTRRAIRVHAESHD